MDSDATRYLNQHHGYVVVAEVVVTKQHPEIALRLGPGVGVVH